MLFGGREKNLVKAKEIEQGGQPTAALGEGMATDCCGDGGRASFEKLGMWI